MAACLVQGLIVASTVARLDILFLLFRLAAGADLSDAVDLRREIRTALPIITHITETGTRQERLQCVDLLSMYARFDRDCYQRATYLLAKVAATGPDEARAVGIELSDLATSTDLAD